jgi:hypothetical protein
MNCLDICELPGSWAEQYTGGEGRWLNINCIQILESVTVVTTGRDGSAGESLWPNWAIPAGRHRE